MEEDEYCYKVILLFSLSLNIFKAFFLTQCNGIVHATFETSVILPDHIQVIKVFAKPSDSSVQAIMSSHGITNIALRFEVKSMYCRGILPYSEGFFLKRVEIGGPVQFMDHSPFSITMAQHSHKQHLNPSHALPPYVSRTLITCFTITVVDHDGNEWVKVQGKDQLVHAESFTEGYQHQQCGRCCEHQQCGRCCEQMDRCAMIRACELPCRRLCGAHTVQFPVNTTMVTKAWNDPSCLRLRLCSDDEVIMEALEHPDPLCYVFLGRPIGYWIMYGCTSANEQWRIGVAVLIAWVQKYREKQFTSFLRGNRSIQCRNKRLPLDLLTMVRQLVYKKDVECSVIRPEFQHTVAQKQSADMLVFVNGMLSVYERVIGPTRQ